MRSNPLDLANQAQKMAKNAGDESAVFQKVALISIGVMAAASASQRLLSLLREINRKEGQRRGRGRE